jgi:hypothetical protein
MLKITDGSLQLVVESLLLRNRIGGIPDIVVFCEVLCFAVIRCTLVQTVIDLCQTGLFGDLRGFEPPSIRSFNVGCPHLKFHKTHRFFHPLH